jgi:hypothetical protein
VSRCSLFNAESYTGTAIEFEQANILTLDIWNLPSQPPIHLHTWLEAVPAALKTSFGSPHKKNKPTLFQPSSAMDGVR